MKRIGYIVSLLSVFVGCADTAETPELILPEITSASVAIDTSNQMSVDAQIKATKVNYFTANFDYGNSEIFERSNTGVFSHAYTEGGQKDVLLRAHATDAAFRDTIIRISIQEKDVRDADGIPLQGYVSPRSYNGYTLVWEEDFDGNSLNTTDWKYEIGRGQGGWGNNELQYYTKENTSVKNGYLTITADRDPLYGYSSSRLITQGKQSFKYGRIDIRAAMPEGKGLWPALWMLGNSISTVGWPRCGEIDIMEMVGGSSSVKQDAMLHGTVHWWDDQNQRKVQYGDSTYKSDGKLSEAFHVYSIVWDDKKIEWYFDNKLYHDIDITPADLSEFKQEFFLILNVAVGGNWPGGVSPSTTFPQKMHVDYIRVFQK